MNYVQDIQKRLLEHIRIGKGLQSVYALLVLVKGEDVTLEDVHDAWAVNINQTWNFEQYGNHRSLIAFDQLSKEIQDKDQQYVDAIKAVAREDNPYNSKAAESRKLNNEESNNSNRHKLRPRT